MDIDNKKIAILGLGEENLKLVQYIAQFNPQITICDQKSREELSEQLQQISNIPYQLQLGNGYLDNLKNFDIVFRTPGIPYLDPKIQEAKKNGVIISSEIKLFFEQCPCPILGVTGTKGKGTTTMLISEILTSSSKIKNQKSKVYSGGNIGNAPIEVLDKLTPDDVVVLELSSFMLQDLEISPHIAVVLDIKSDHLDVHQTQEEYIESKKNIVRFQNQTDFSVINTDYPESANFANETSAKIYLFSRQKEVEGCYALKDQIILNIDGKRELAKISEITLRGEHNLENICAASLASYLAGADIQTISSIIKSFKGLEHRLEFVGNINGVKYYNDSFSTTPDTCIAAIKSFTEPIILIAGGSEKNADYTELGKTISQSNVKTSILIGETGPRIKSQIQSSLTKRQVPKIIDNCKNLEEVVETAKHEAKPGDVVLLSPASASFDWFKNYKERGELFKELVIK